MTQRLEQVFERSRAVPEAQQDQLANFLLNELEEDERWSASTAQHEQKFRKLVDEVLADDDRGMCEPLDPERL